MASKSSAFGMLLFFMVSVVFLFYLIWGGLSAGRFGLSHQLAAQAAEGLPGDPQVEGELAGGCVLLNGGVLFQ